MSAGASDVQNSYVDKSRKTLQIQVENSNRAQKVNDLVFYNRQRQLYPNAEIFYDPQTYTTLIQSEREEENNDNERNKALLEQQLLTITNNKTTISRIIALLTDTEIEALVYFFPDFRTELEKNTKSNAITFEVFFAFTKKYLTDKFITFNNIKQEIPLPPINPTNPLFPDNNDGYAEMKVDEEDLPTNRNIGIMGRNNQYNALPKKGENQSRTTMEQMERNNPPPTKRKAKGEATNPKPTKKRAIIENITGKRGNELPNESDNKKTKIDTTFGPFSPAYKLKRILLLFFQRTPARIPEFLPFSNSYVQIKPFIQGLDEETTQKLYDRVIAKYPRKSLPNETAGTGIMKKNRIVFQGKGSDAEYSAKKFYVDMKMLNKNILAVKYHSTRNYKYPAIPITDECKHVIMDILTDRFNQRLFDLLDENSKKNIARFIQVMKLEDQIPIKDTSMEEFFKQFLILKGQYLNGNDNPEIKKQLRKYTLELLDMKKLPKQNGYALLHELSL
jgi:hypothetical protein